MTDATFEDGGEEPLRLKALDAEDLTVISALVQDAIFPASEMSWQPKARRFGLLLNRFRWEDADAAAARHRSLERVQSVLLIEDVVKVQSSGIPKGDKDVILSLLSVSWEPGLDGTGRLLLALAGDGAIALTVETLDVVVRDVTRPYLAPSGKMPLHND